MKTATWLGYGFLVVASAVACWRLWSQPLAPTPAIRPAVKRPTQTGQYLLVEASDFRKNLFDQETIDARIRRGVVCLVRPDFSVSGSVEEHSTNEWNTVAAALRSIGILERGHFKPQIRVLRRNAILQSTIYLQPGALVPTFDGSSTTATGYYPWFLEQELRAGDAIIVTAFRD